MNWLVEGADVAGWARAGAFVARNKAATPDSTKKRITGGSWVRFAPVR